MTLPEYYVLCLYVYYKIENCLSVPDVGYYIELHQNQQ